MSNEAELIAIYGRRRIGKTFLIRNFYQKELIFEFSGKFSISEFVIDKKYAAALAQKERVFRQKTQTRKTLFLTLITTYGAKKNDNYVNLIQKEITMEALFNN